MYGRPFVSKLAMTTLCKKWITSRDNIDTSLDELHTSRNEFHTSRDNCIRRAITALLHAKQDNIAR